MADRRMPLLGYGLTLLCVGLGGAAVGEARGAELLWLLATWGALAAICLLLSSGRSRALSALAPLAGVAALATLAQGAASLPICALMAVVLVLTLATLLEVSMYVPEIIITEQDSYRLASLLEDLPYQQRRSVAALEAELARAQVVEPEKVPRDVVTMNSRVIFEEAESGKRSEMVLVYPRDARASADAVSVLAPVGSALLGMRAGQAIDWRLPSGRLKRYRVLDVVYQPEAAGDFHL